MRGWSGRRPSIHCPLYPCFCLQWDPSCHLRSPASTTNNRIEPEPRLLISLPLIEVINYYYYYFINLMLFYFIYIILFISLFYF